MLSPETNDVRNEAVVEGAAKEMRKRKGWEENVVKILEMAVTKWGRGGMGRLNAIPPIDGMLALTLLLLVGAMMNPSVTKVVTSPGSFLYGDVTRKRISREAATFV